MRKKIVLLALTVLYTVFPTPALSSYQIELDLRSFTSSDRTFTCSQENRCTTRFIFNAMVDNFNQSETFDYDHAMNMINFGSCEQFPTSDGQANPLMFMIPSSNWGEGQEIGFNVEVQDIVGNDPVSGDPTFGENWIIMFNITRPSTPNGIFMMYQNFSTSDGAATLELRWRIICAPGTCGATCSQTRNCYQFRSACPIRCCNNMPCQNGGTCTNTTAAPGGYMCDCPQAYEGENCEIVDSCSSSPCENRGTCNQVPASTDYTCECTPMYTGTTCTDLVSTPTQDPATTDNNGGTSTSATTKDIAESYHASNSYWILIPLLVFLAQQLF